MSLIVYLSVTLLITLLGTYLVIENNRKKAESAKKAQYQAKYQKLNNALKEQVKLLSDARFIKPKDATSLQSISNHFFVVQPKTEENLQLLEQLVDSLVFVFASEMNKTLITLDKETLTKQLQHFIADLPKSGIGFNQEFYQQQLPAMITLLKTPDVNLGDNTEQGDNNEQSPELVTDHQIEKAAS
jgi:hypothetical protein